MEIQREAPVKDQPGLGGVAGKRHPEQRNDWRVGTEQKGPGVGSRGTVTSSAGERLWKVLTAAHMTHTPF